ncbi:hypothetical protein [Conservatibacter flavescens]|uniref:Lipopolysaccharide biosynthesis protein n=1 Tax=Conservatibacter flavescens TaxID=28161 RepID=A0A2M8S048_9PAST|nr:hypothetical protein [Conservatibacter flavescens]PJG84505.1 hypothetical protein CVP05_10820 [Conservatibacter flavescens]
MKNQEQKNILLALSTVHGISDLIHKNLEHYGFNVINIARYDRKERPFEYPSIMDNIKVKFRKIFLKDKEAKLKLQSEILKKELVSLLGDNKVDYSLFFLAQCFSQDFLKYVKSRTKENGMINYQWDGMRRYPSVLDRLEVFDRCYVFDADDLQLDPKLKSITNFYFDYDLAPLPCEYDFYFLGGHKSDRCELMVNFAKYAEKMHWNINFNVVYDGNNQNLYPKNVTLLKPGETLSFEENLYMARKSKVLLDFVISDHKGLSLRVFEALGHNKKLITTNKEVKKYDFYHPNNIFILDNNFDDIQDFLAKPFICIDQHIKEKYSFGNWIRYILDITPHIPINLPKE